jgi:ATP-dependent RNA helicase DDX47/RRP3
MTFESLGLDETLCEICSERGWLKPTPIQAEAIPVALKGRDVIGLAETGSGKTGAFLLPILMDILQHNRRNISAVIIAPTRLLFLFYFGFCDCFFYF